jgi:hypothetical protein
MTVTTDTVSPRWRALRQHPVQPDTWFGLAGDYAARGLPLQAGYAARQALRLAPERRAASWGLGGGGRAAAPMLDGTLGR